MGSYNEYAYFMHNLESLIKIKNRYELKKKAKELEIYVLSHSFSNQALRMALHLSTEFDALGLKVSNLEDYIINSKNQYYILRFARTIKKANIKKLQDATIASNDLPKLARFGFSIDGADKNVIGDIIAKSDNAKAAYIYMRGVKSYDFNKLKHIIFKSKRPKYLFSLAKLTEDREELDLIQNLIIESSSCTYVRLYAVHIQGADIGKLEAKIIETRDVKEMKRFAAAVNSKRLAKLSSLF
jgi:hypothetical protein